MKRSTLPLLCCLLASCFSPVFGLDWAPSLEEAKKRAEVEGKLVLALFYDSERTRRDTSLRRELMDGEDFRAYAEDKFVPVELVEPEDNAQTEAIHQHRALCLEYGINCWPTTVVMRPDGIPTGGFTGVPGDDDDDGDVENESPLDTLRHALDKGIQVADMLRTAEAQQPGRQQLLNMASAFYRLPQDLGPRLALARYIAERDSHSITGMKETYQHSREMAEWNTLGRYGMDSATTLRKMQEMIDKACPVNRLEMLQQRYAYQAQHLRCEDDLRALTRAAEALSQEIRPFNPAWAAFVLRKHERLYGGEPSEVLYRSAEQMEERKKKRWWHAPSGTESKVSDNQQVEHPM